LFWSFNVTNDNITLTTRGLVSTGSITVRRTKCKNEEYSIILGMQSIPKILPIIENMLG